MNHFRVVGRLLAAIVLISVAGIAAAQPQAFPAKPIRLIVPFAAGGNTSVLGLLLGEKLTKAWGQPVIVDHRPGGNTVIGAEALAKSAPDGYTILLTNNSHVINPSLVATLPYDPVKDFAPVATVYASEFVLAMNPSVPANNLKEFIALAKSRPGQLNYSSSGAGGAGHLLAELFNSTAGVDIRHIPYKGGAPAITDTISGQVQITYSTPNNLVQHFQSGKLKALAVTGETRYAGLPQVPTFAEAGLPSVDVKNWQGLFAPAGTPRTIIDKFAAEIVNILSMPDVRENLVSQGANPYIRNPDQFAELVRTEIAKYAKIIKTANIKIEK
jgi:tripartite-type tricarboxylate transporter receptor subunit TctC